MNEWISTRPYRRNDDRHRFRHICNRPLDFWNAEFRLFAETNATKGHRELFMKEHSTIPLIPIPSESKRVPTSETSVVSYAMVHTRFSQEHSCTPLLIFRDQQFLREYLGNLWKGVSISSEFYANILRDDCCN